MKNQATFEGFVRPDGRVGTRNYIGILTSANCSATAANYIADAFKDIHRDTLENIDGVTAFTYGTGYGMNINGTGLTLLPRTLTGYAFHPNLAGSLMVGLGCEVNQISE